MQQDPASTQPAAGSVPPPADAAAVMAAPAGMAPAGHGDAAALSQMGFDHLIHHFDALGWAVFIVLSIMTVGSWYFILLNAWRAIQIRSRADKVRHVFWETTSAQEAVRIMEDQPKWEPFSKIALDCASSAAHHQRHEGSRLVEALNRSEFIDRALRQGVARESARLEGGLTWLATTGSTAPFVGLLGTVWGIYHALIAIGASGNAGIETVAGPVGEALIMTAMGLGVAIPAVLAYNIFVRANRVTNAHFDEFAHDLHDFFATGSRVDAGAAATLVAPKAGAAIPPRK
jgi:biopolymer transport protein ExbB